MPRRQRWVEAPVKDGYGVVKLLRWRYFLDYIQQQMLDYEAYIWRGHRRDDWELEPTLDRLVRRSRIAPTKLAAFRLAHLEQFKYATRGRRGTNPPQIESENDWWALGQHQGLATPLLDWTLSPFVAAYFAFIETGTPQTRNRAIFALHRPSVAAKSLEIHREEMKKQEDHRQEERQRLESARLDARIKALVAAAPLPEIRRPVELIRPMSNENPRLVSQGGLFTRAPDDIPLERWVQRSFPGESGSYVLMKILIPNRDREDCLKMLNRMNINHLALFPDLFGASKYCNLHLEIKGY
jgi:hypothetical protein